MSAASPHIGTLGEGPLHSALKEWYSRPGDRTESSLDGFVIDLVRDDLLIEIQTRGFSSMKRKLTHLIESGRRVRIVHPVAVDRTIVKISDDGEIFDRRLSPKHGTVVDVCSELVSFPELLNRPAFEVEVVMTREEELRRREEGKAWRRKGWVVVERRLVEIVGSHSIDGPTALLDLLPARLSETFTTSDVADGLGCSARLAQQLAYCLRKTGAIVVVGKRGRSVEYRTA